MHSRFVERYMEPLLAGDRVTCRELVRSQLDEDVSGRKLYEDLLWPAMTNVEQLYRNDKINVAVEHMATRINRVLADQLQQSLERNERKGKRILIMCASGEPEELGAQMCSDLFEADGWDVYFVGGGIPNDEVLSLVGQLRPEILLVFGTQPRGVPEIRALIDLIREVGCNPTMNIMISGGVFNRAEGLWNEINADLFAREAREAIEIANSAQPRPIEPPTTGVRKKRRRRRRRPPLLANVDA